MKKRVLTLLMLSVNIVNAQSEIDTTIKVDLLRAPSSPASNLLGIAPSDIEKPTDVSSFMLSLRSATNNFTTLPSNYAIDIAPYWIFKNSKKGDITTKGLSNSSGKNVIKQTLVLSFAFRNPDSTETEINAKSAFGGFGFKFAICRGKYDPTTKKALAVIKSFQDEKIDHLKRIARAYDSIPNPKRDSLQNVQNSLFRAGMTPDEQNAVRSGKRYMEIDSILSQMVLDFQERETTEAQLELDRQIQAKASTFQIARVGWTWDIAGGISTEFRNKRFDNSKLYNAGLWTTIGYTDSVYGAGLFILRLLHNPDKIFAKDNAINDIDDITTLDAGIRYIYGRSQSKFNASLEAIYRSILSSETIDPSWRLVFNAEYAIWQNQKLTFSFGRNFDGTISKDGNLVAALTFLTGFGNKR